LEGEPSVCTTPEPTPVLLSASASGSSILLPGSLPPAHGVNVATQSAAVVVFVLSLVPKYLAAARAASATAHTKMRYSTKLAPRVSSKADVVRRPRAGSMGIYGCASWQRSDQSRKAATRVPGLELGVSQASGRTRRRARCGIDPTPSND